ncbi:MAG TPA: ABC transporter substrate-binding protein [Casimicrobiaceae bacterium]|nr:ABC transporter substrate-binding protein [Casimicrobiaceae bacterium]
MKKLLAVLIACYALALTDLAAAADNVIRIGAIYPLSGALASTGSELKAAIELAADLINQTHPELKGVAIATGSGLAHLGGAKIEVVFADSQGKPEIGQAEAERLIDQEHVVALIGAYQSAVTKTTSRIAEQRGVPYLNPESSSPELTERGYKWFFRTTPNDETFIGNMMQFLDTLKSVPTKRIAVVYENTDFGVNTAKAVEKFAKQARREVVASIPYSAGTASVSSETQKLAASKPDVAIFASYTSDALLFVRTMREAAYAPPVFLANDAGFIDARFVSEVGPQVQGVLTRDVWANDLYTIKPVIKQLNDMFKARSGKELNGNSARSLQGVLVLAEAIDRAGSTKPEAIRQALAAIDLSADQVVMPWAGVKFDASGQNERGQGLILQLVGSGYNTVWPERYKQRQDLPTVPFLAWKH